jgi:hypothetical protein
MDLDAISDLAHQIGEVRETHHPEGSGTTSVRVRVRERVGGEGVGGLKDDASTSQRRKRQGNS